MSAKNTLKRKSFTVVTKEFVKIQRPKLHYITTLKEYLEVEARLWMHIHTSSQVESSLESKLSFGPHGECRSQTWK